MVETKMRTQTARIVEAMKIDICKRNPDLSFCREQEYMRESVVHVRPLFDEFCATMAGDVVRCNASWPCRALDGACAMDEQRYTAAKVSLDA